MDKAVSGPAEAKNWEDQEGNSSSKRQAGRSESERRKAYFYLTQMTHKDKDTDKDIKRDSSSERQAGRPESEGRKARIL